MGEFNVDVSDLFANGNVTEEVRTRRKRGIDGRNNY